MAEAPPCTSRFFCHICSLEISPRLPEYMCPQCESGFIEELLEERSADNGSMSTMSSGPQNQQPLENLDQHLSMFPSGFGQFSVSVFDDTFDLGPGLRTEDNRDAENQSERDMSSRQRYGARQSRSRHGSRRQAGRHDGAPTLEGIIQQLVNGIIGPPANIGVGAWGVLHSNPMDYAWGANGLDAIITQLLNQFENSGPPPADSDKIKSLPTVEITDEHVASGLECPVCKEDYSVGENVRQLPCNHMFHNDCIVPWLEQHDTCPVCRTSLTGLNTATNPPELSEMNFTSSPSSSSSSSSSSSTSSSPPSSDSTSNESSADNSNVNNGRADASGAACDWEEVEKRENVKRFVEFKAPLKRGESKGRRPGEPRRLPVFL